MKNKKKYSSRRRTKFILPVVALCAAVSLLGVFILREHIGAMWPFGETEPGPNVITPTFSDAIIVDDSLKDIFSLDCGLEITDLAAYAGIYMEDGSDEIVSNVMMMVLKNTTQKDLQLAQIVLAFSDFSAEFEVTNLPAGASIVLLEKNRHEMVDEAPSDVAAYNVVFFQDPMIQMDDRLEITGLNGALNVKNVSGEDIDGDIYIYYKNSATDLFYGGITYRVKIEGLNAGEIKQATAGHYHKNSCTILMVTVSG